MSGTVASKTAKDKSAGKMQDSLPEPTHQAAYDSLQADTFSLQHTAGNHAVSQVLEKGNEISPTAQNGLPPIVQSVLNSGSGQPLDPSTREFMESRFGQDFSHVRIHTDSQAAESARAVNAFAYTVGKDIAFDAGEYAPDSSSGKRLLAHELAHVIQQGRGGPLPTLSPTASHECSAEAASLAVAAGGPTIGVKGATGIGLALASQRGSQPPIELGSFDLSVLLDNMRNELGRLRRQARRSGSVQEEALRTFATATIVHQNGSTETVSGAFLHSGAHAEEQIEQQLRNRVKRGDTVFWMVDQIPCPERCTKMLKAFPDKHGVSQRVFVPAAEQKGEAPDVEGGGRHKVLRSPKGAIQQESEVTQYHDFDEFRRILPSYKEPKAGGSDQESKRRGIRRRAHTGAPKAAARRRPDRPDQPAEGRGVRRRAHTSVSRRAPAEDSGLPNNQAKRRVVRRRVHTPDSKGLTPSGADVRAKDAEAGKSAQMALEGGTEKVRKKTPPPDVDLPTPKVHGKTSFSPKIKGIAGSLIKGLVIDMAIDLALQVVANEIGKRMKPPPGTKPFHQKLLEDVMEDNKDQIQEDMDLLTKNHAHTILIRQLEGKQSFAIIRRQIIERPDNPLAKYGSGYLGVGFSENSFSDIKIKEGPSRDQHTPKGSETIFTYRTSVPLAFSAKKLDEYVEKAASALGSVDPTKEKASGSPILPSLLVSHLRKKLKELDKSQKKGTLSPEKAAIERERLLSLIKGIEPQHQKELEEKEKRERAKKHRAWLKWKKELEARKKPLKRKKGTTGLPVISPGAVIEPKATSFFPSPARMEGLTPLQKANAYVKNLEFWAMDLIVKAENQKQKEFLKEEAMWRQYVTNPPGWVGELPGDVEFKLEELLQRFGAKLQEFRNMFGG